jgi:hypothetical protein
MDVTKVVVKPGQGRSVSLGGMPRTGRKPLPVHERKSGSDNIFRVLSNPRAGDSASALASLARRLP